MRYLGTFVIALFVWACSSSTGDHQVDFNRDIRPILSDRCFACHGPDKEGRKADLRLDLAEGALEQVLESGHPAFVPHNPSKSTAIERILSDDPELLMPPPESELSLSKEEIELLTQWVEQGAKYDPHWAFISPHYLEAPDQEGSTWAKNEIDPFIEKGLKDRGFVPQKEADKEALIRRVSFDLTGLPPSVSEIEAFLTDSSDQAFERVVDRLLASEAYGEHMAVSWMDLARYADTYGYTVDRYRPTWPWRDWVIQAFNDNMPYDQFVTWQIAGDLLPERSKEQRIATAFNRNHSQNAEGGIVNEEFQVEYVSDRTHTFGTAFLGLTMECARCHDHKYDPISQKDYYQLFSYFNQVDESGQITFSTVDMPAPTMLMPDEAMEEKMAFLKREIGKWEALVEEYPEKGKELQDFKAWLKEAPTTLDKEPTGKLAQFSFENPSSGIWKSKEKGVYMGKFIDPVTLRKATSSPEQISGSKGKGLRLNGDDALDFPDLGRFTKSDPFSIGLWVNVPKELNSGVIFHSNRGGIIFNFKGYQVSLEENHWDVRLAHAFPYNAIHLVSKDTIAKEQWQHLMLTYDGSSQAEGVNLYVNGQPLSFKVEQDQLYKDIVFQRERTDTHLKVGARWRSKGFKGGGVDELVVYDRELSPIEVRYWVDASSPLQHEEKGNPRSEEELLPVFLHQQSGYQAMGDSLTAYRKQYDKLVESIQELMVIEEREAYRPTYLLERGAYDAPGEEVFPLPPEVLIAEGMEYPSNRLGLVQWLFSTENPLTARVVANRLWQQCFGRGLVKTAEDFGNQGSLPTYPKLLDYLAIELMESGWDIKALLRQIVTSATYRQSSEASDLVLENDPENEWISRGPSQRLSAEMLRDHILAASGLLVKKVGGPSVKPYQPEGLWRVNTGRYEPDSGANLYRRSLYTFWKRTVPPPSMNTFDAPSRSYCLVRRQKTHTPLQALTLLNDPQFQEAARVMGQKILEEGMSKEEGIGYIFTRLTSRYPTEEELSTLVDLFQEQKEVFEKEPNKAKGWLEVGEYPLPETFDPATLSAYAIVGSTIMNFYEAIHK